MKRIRFLITAWFCRASNSLMILAGVLLALDHYWSVLTWGALSLAAGAMIIRGADN